MMDAVRTPLIPLFILQGVILFLLGTGQVAGAMTAEGDEGALSVSLAEDVWYLLTEELSIWAVLRLEIALEVLRYWSVERQEAYAGAELATRRLLGQE